MISFWNIRTILENGIEDPTFSRPPQRELQPHKLDILDLNKVRWLNSGDDFSNSCHTNLNVLLNSGKLSVGRREVRVVFDG